MDPGNWGTDLAAGSRYGYDLLWVLVVSNAVALPLQYLSLKLGVASGRHLAEAIGERLGTRGRVAFWLVAECAMLATELAELLGVVVALRVLFGLPLDVAVLAAVAVVVGLVALAGDSLRRMERSLAALLVVVAVAYVVELALAGPSASSIARGAVTPRLPPGALLVAAGMVGATVMPHNLFLHSGLILSRRTADRAGVIRRAGIETAVALNLALLVNAAILVMAAAVFAPAGLSVSSLAEAHRTLRPLLGGFAQLVFGLALLASGLASSATGALAGQLVLDGLLGWRVALPARRLVTAVPAVVALLAGVDEIDALVWSQVVLAVALPFVVIPLVRLTSDRTLMGPFANGPIARRGGMLVAAMLCALNALLVGQLVW